MKKFSPMLLFLSFLILLILMSPYCLNALALSQNEPFERGIFGSVLISTFSTDCRLTGNVSFTIRSNQTSNFVLFLPSSKGLSLIENCTREIDFGLFEFNYSEPNFQGKCFSYGYWFPYDYYDLVFIIGFDKDVFVDYENIKLDLAYEDRLLYANWDLTDNVKKVGINEVRNYANHVAPSKEQFNSVIEKNNLSSFYILNAKISRAGQNANGSLLLCTPPVLIVLIYIGLVIVKIAGKSRKISNHKITLYTGTAFFLSTYLIAVKNYLPPILTVIEGVILMGIVLSLLMLEEELLGLGTTCIHYLQILYHEITNKLSSKRP